MLLVTTRDISLLSMPKLCTGRNAIVGFSMAIVLVPSRCYCHVYRSQQGTYMCVRVTDKFFLVSLE